MNNPAETAGTRPDKLAGMSPRSLVFWRHIAAISILLLAQHPRLYGNVQMFLGLWLGSLVIAFGASALVCGLGYLFLTPWFKGKVFRAYVICAWVIAGLQLFGQWVLPKLMEGVVAGGQRDMSSAPVSSSHSAPMAIVQGGEGNCQIPRGAFEDYLWDKEIEDKHPGWGEIIKTQEFVKWLIRQDLEVTRIWHSHCTADKIHVLNLYKKKPSS